MIRSALVLCAGIILATSVACAPASSPPTAAAAAAGCDIGSRITELGPGFSPAGYGNCIAGAHCPYDDPTRYINNPPSSAFAAEKAAIISAYNIAPSFFQTALCGVSAIYVDSDTDTTKPPSWGMRERLFPTGARGYRTHIGISARLLTALQSAPNPYAWYEQAIVAGLAGTVFDQPPGPPPSLPPSSATWVSHITFAANPDPAPASLSPTPYAIALLSVLAHEVGHVIWFDQIVAANAPPSSNDPLPALDTFYEFSWKTPTHKRGFHLFGEGNSAAKPLHPPVDADFVRYLQNSDTPDAAIALNKIYGGEWASLLATIAPDEDFVETYTLMAVAASSGGPLQSLKISIPATSRTPGYTDDILANLTQPSAPLYKKAQWITDCLGLQPGGLPPTCTIPSWRRGGH